MVRVPGVGHDEPSESPESAGCITVVSRCGGPVEQSRRVTAHGRAPRQACGCTSSPARAGPGRPRSPRRSPWRSPRAILHAGAARRGRGAPGHQPDLRRPPAGHHGDPDRRASGGGEVWALSVDAKAALLEYLQIFYKLGRAGRVLEKFGAIDFATTIAPGSATSSSSARSTRRTAPRRRPALAPDRTPAYDAIVLDAPPTGRIGPLPLGQLGGRRPRQGRPHPQPGRLDHRDAHVAADGGHVVTLLEEMPVQETLDAVPSCGPRLPGRDRRSSTWSGRRCFDEAGLGGARADSRRPKVRGQLARPRPPGVTAELVQGLLERGHDHALRVAQEPSSSGSSSRLGLPMFRAPAEPGRGRRLACGSSPTCSSTGWADGEGRGEHRAHPTRTAPRRRRAARRPGIDIVVCCGSGGVGKTTTAARARPARGRAGPPGGRPDHRPGPPAGPVAGPHRARQHPRPVEDIDTTAGGQPRRDDARHEADLRRGRRGPLRPRRRPSRSSRTPSTRRSPAPSPGRRSTWRWRSSASSEAERPAGGPRWDLIVVDTRRRGRRSTSSTRPSGWAASSTAGSSGSSPRRPRPAAAPAQGLQRRDRPGLLDAVARPRRPDAPRRADLRRALDTMFGVPQRADQTYRCCWPSGRRPSSSSPRPSATPCGRRPTSSRGWSRSGCRSPASCSTGSSRCRRPG